MDREILSTGRKALKLNLNPTIFGSFAEIGGGQEVARQFFHAGGASGTVAKTISAYDKAFSDYIYDPDQSGRYVSEARLIKMLDAEYEELIKVLGQTEGRNTLFFAYANTVETLNYQKSNHGHGWIGMRFQLKPETPPNEIILHVNMLENDGLLQQESLGILGVNLIYACFFLSEYPSQLIRSLLDNLSPDRIEITFIRMKGPDLDYVDNRLLALQLVKNGMTPAIMFDRNGTVQQPSDMLYKKNVLAFRGSFRPVTYVLTDMLRTSYRIFKRDEDYERNNTLALCELTLNNLQHQGTLDEIDLLDRIEILNGMGQHVMVSTFREYYKLVEYFSGFKIKKLRIVIGIPTLMKVLEKKYYQNLRGGILEALGKLFVENMKLYVYPTLSSVSLEKRTSGGDLITSENLELSPDIAHIYSYLKKNKMIIDITDARKDILWINPENVLKMIRDHMPGWEETVPKYVAHQIRKRRLFGYDE